MPCSIRKKNHSRGFRAVRKDSVEHIKVCNILGSSVYLCILVCGRDFHTLSEEAQLLQGKQIISQELSCRDMDNVSLFCM